MIFSDPFIAGTKSTQAFAKRQMNIQGNPALGIVSAKTFMEQDFPGSKIRFALPEGHTGVTGVPGNLDIIRINKLFQRFHADFV